MPIMAPFISVFSNLGSGEQRKFIFISLNADGKEKGPPSSPDVEEAWVKTDKNEGSHF